MTRTQRTFVLASIAIASAALLAAFLLMPSLQTDPERPDELEPLVAWLAHHPADWLAASAITDRSLDSALSLPQRVALWRSSYALAHYLAPLRPNATAGFVRAGLFHWYELGKTDRDEVLKSARPLLRDPKVFASLHRPLWELTRDLGYLRRAAPPTIPSLLMLRELAVTSGDFQEYRELRSALRDARMREFQAKRATSTIADLIALLPESITDADVPLVRAILEEIDRRPFDVEHMGHRLDELAQFAIRHDLKPLTALQPLVEINGKLTNPTRARLAIALGDRAAAVRIELLTAATTAPEWMRYHLERAAFEEKRGDSAMAAMYRARAKIAEPQHGDAWQNYCSPQELCTSVFRTHEQSFAFKLAPAQTDQIPPYVEVYLDDVLIAEAEIREEKAFTVTTGPGLHRTEVRLVNRHMRNGTQRRVRLS